MLDIRGLYKTFNPGTINEKHALNGVDLHLEDGDFVTIIGGNGAGKSTLMNAIAGVWPVDEGAVLIDGKDISGLCEYQRAAFLGRVFQDPMTGTAADMTILENMSLASMRGKRRGLRWGINKNQSESFREMLKKLDLGLEDRLTAKVGLLSGGQRQALTLLMSTIVRPKLLMLDEHTAALDPKTAAKVLSLTQQIIQEQKLTALMVTHNMRDALLFGNRTIMMHEGRIILDLDEETKHSLDVSDLMRMFGSASGAELNNDRMLLS